jgi:cellulose synthase operon protein C
VKGPVLCSLALLAALGCANGPPPPATSPAGTLGRALTADERLSLGRAELAQSRYAQAEKSLITAASVRSTAARAELALGELYLTTGRYEQASSAAQKAAQLDPSLSLAALELRADAWMKSGKLSEAEAALTPFAARPDAPALRLLLGEILLETGRREQAEPVLLSLVEDYNEDRIAEDDGRGLARAARAAWLLRHPRDADTLFNEAERATPGDPQTLLWRAELFLEKYDSGHAEEVLRELLEKAPYQPGALTLLAHVRLDQAYDFDEAERLARAALAGNPAFGPAHFVLAGVALRDMDLDEAERRIGEGLRHNPRNLELLSLRAAARFLADDRAGFQREKSALLAQNREYSRLYAILAEFADWEHRYDEIVELMREALGVDAEDAAALSQLGFNLIRAGQDGEGVSALNRAFKLDPYNVRVFNTLNLYETLIPKSYVTIDTPPFRIRYHVDDRAILERYVPGLLKRAWESMSRAYEFTPTVPVGIELYAERESFAVRTSGLPQTAIQGVCFGKTLASMSPQNESFNLGMTLWHELSHVFHIQLSKSRVPRWFTEGLAEYETTIERPEWTREHDPELYAMTRRGKLPAVERMSRAFTRAEDIEDVATAYFASSQIVEHLARRAGRGQMAKMLRAWGEGRRGDDVFRSVLGQSSAEVDREFRAVLERRFQRYASQFVPEQRPRPLSVVSKLSQQAPRDADLGFEFALSLLRSGEPERAARQAKLTLALDPKHAQTRYLLARVATADNDWKQADALVRAMLKDGQTGYAVQLLRGEIAREQKDAATARSAFELAHAADPTQSEPLAELADLAAAEKVPEEEVRHLEKLARLSEHSAAVHRRLLAKLIELGRFAEAVQVGEAALWADVDGLDTHLWFAEALLAAGDSERARFELESATLCRGEPAERAEAHARLAELLLKLKRPKEARVQLERANELDPSNPRAKKLRP